MTKKGQKEWSQGGGEAEGKDPGQQRYRGKRALSRSRKRQRRGGYLLLLGRGVLDDDRVGRLLLGGGEKADLLLGDEGAARGVSRRDESVFDADSLDASKGSKLTRHRQEERNQSERRLVGLGRRAFGGRVDG